MQTKREVQSVKVEELRARLQEILPPSPLGRVKTTVSLGGGGCIRVYLRVTLADTKRVAGVASTGD